MKTHELLQLRIRLTISGYTKHGQGQDESQHYLHYETSACGLSVIEDG